MRVTPRIWIGLTVFVGYAVLVFGIQAASGIPYTTWGDSAENLFFGVVVSLIVSSLVLAVVVTALGWWRPVLRDRTRSRHRWPIIAPILLTVIAVVGLFSADWTAVGGAFLLAALGLCLVGFTEEIVTRGVLLVALRSRLAEVWVWLVSSSLFALMHLINVALGQSLVATLPQVLAAFSTGTILYILRRTTGSLVPAMLLHALWDFTIFILGNGSPGVAAGLAQALYVPVAVLGLIGVAFVIRHADERLIPIPQDSPRS